MTLRQAGWDGGKMKIPISTMLIFTIVAASIMGTLIGAYFLYQQTSTELVDAVYRNLASAAGFKADHLKTYVTGIERETAQGASRVTFSKLLTTDKNSSGYQSALDSAQASVEQLQKTDPYYEEVFLMDMGAKIVISSDKSKIGVDKSSDPFFTNGQKNTAIRNVYYSDVTGKPQIGATSPVFDGSGKVVGVYAARINLGQLDDIMADRNGLGTSGEMVLVNWQKYALTPLRYDKGSVLHLFVNTTLVQKCVESLDEYNNTGRLVNGLNDSSLIYTDYRGVKVVGAYGNALPMVPWCVIAKIDESEALGQPLAKMFDVFMIFSLSLVVFIGVVVYLISRMLSKSIIRLSEDVSKITKGDLNIRLAPSSIAEVQSLTDSLNRVLASLKLAVLRAGMSKDEMGIGNALLAGKAAEAKFNAIYDNSGDAIMTLEAPGWKFTSGNHSSVSMFGTNNEQEFISMAPWELSPKYQPDGQPSDKKARKMIMKALDEGSAFFEWTHRRRNGDDFPATVLLMKMNVGGKDLLQATVRDITEQKKMEGNLEYELKFSKTVLSAMQQGVDIVDEDLNIVYMNPAFEKIFGKDCIGKKCYQVYKDNKRQCEACPLQKPIKVGETRAIVVPGIKESRIFEISHTGMVLPNGKKAILELFRDITSEIENTERKRLFELGFESSPDSQLMVDYAGGKPKIARINASFTKYYGYSSDEVIGKNPKIIKSGAQNAEYYKRMWKALLDPKVGYWRDEIINKRKNGGLMNVLLVINTIFDNGGKPRSFLASHLDMSGQRRAEKELSSSKALQQAALDSIHDSFFVCDTKGRFLSWNKEFREATGYSDLEIPRLQATDLFSGMDVVRVANAIRKGLKTGTATVRANVIAKDKKLLPTEFSGTVLKNQNGKIIGFTGVGRRLKHI